MALFVFVEFLNKVLKSFFVGLWSIWHCREHFPHRYCDIGDSILANDCLT